MSSAAGFGVRSSGFGWNAWLIALVLASGCAYGGTLHDPTRPDFASPAKTAHATAGWQLNSTLISAHRRLAMINGKTVGVGDRVDGATVIAIRAGAVRLRRSGRQFTIHLIATTIKTRKAADRGSS